MSSGSKNLPLVRVDEFSLPQGRPRRAIFISAIMMLLSTRASLLQPGSPLFDYLLSGKPTAVKISRWIQQALFYFLFGAHSIEALCFAFVRLRRHGIAIMSGLGVKWLAAVFLGGQFAWKHFDDVVLQKARSR